jgi:hypothetical protein
MFAASPEKAAKQVNGEATNPNRGNHISANSTVKKFSRPSVTIVNNETEPLQIMQRNRCKWCK